MFKERIFRKNY